MSEEIIINECPEINNINVTTTTSINDISVNTFGSVNSVNGKIGNVTLSASDLGLGNVNNTSDLNKPISIATGIVLTDLQNEINSINAFDSSIQPLTGNWNDAYSYVTANSGNTLNEQQASTFINTNSANIIQVDTLVNTTSANWNNVYTNITSNSASYIYENIYANASYSTIKEYAASNPQNIYKGYNITLINNKIYTFAGTDPTNSNHYLEINSNPISPIYAEALLYNNNQAIVDTFYVSDFRSAKYNLQIETNFNNEIYYSEINVVAAVGSAVAIANEYGQVFTSELINSYDAEFDVNRVHLVINFSSEPTNLNHKLIVKGQRTNYYKI
jgi:hypothetical protein